MSLATATLLTDPETLRAFAARLQAELYAKTLHIAKLKAELALLKRARYGRSSERIEQLELLIGELEADEAEQEAKEPPTAPAKREATNSPPRGRQPRGPHAACCVGWLLPAHLPRERVEHAATCACPACGSTRLSRIGTDEREVLEYVPSHFKVVAHVRPKPSCRQCDNITQPPLPSIVSRRSIRSLEETGPAGPGGLADRARPPRSGAAGACSGRQICRPLPALPPERHLCPRRRRAGSVDTGRLGRAERGVAGTAGGGDHPARESGHHPARRRHAGTGARPRTPKDQDRPIMDTRSGRTTLGFGRPAGRELPLLARPQVRACPAAARRM